MCVFVLPLETDGFDIYLYFECSINELIPGKRIFISPALLLIGEGDLLFLLLLFTIPESMVDCDKDAGDKTNSSLFSF